MKILKSLFLFVCLMFVIIANAQLQQNKIDPKTTFQKFSTLIQLINYQYVETADVEKLTEDAIIAMLKSLDPHSIYISKKDVQRVNEPLIGNFEGVGIQFQIYQDTIIVIAAIPGGPSDELGIMSGDKIVKINDELAVGEKINNKFVFDRLRGPKGSYVKISIVRHGVDGLIDFNIKRDKIPLNSIDAAYKINSDIAYVKLSRFARNSVIEFKEALKPMIEEGVDKLILDLRGNTGGYLDVAYNLTDELLPSDKLIVYTLGEKMPRQDFTSKGGGIFEKGKLIVLIDEGSASASEILSGAVQDWDRGIIIGRRSFGKGLVQRPFLLPDSSMVRITTAKYFTPSGRCIQKPFKGVDYRKEITERHKHGEMVHADSIKFPDSLKYYTNNKRLVYGGGGIMPDYFVPMDTTFSSKYLIDISRKGILNNFALHFVDNSREELLKTYYNDDDFIKNFPELNDDFLDKFATYAEEKGVPRNDKDIETSKKYIYNVCKGLIARNLFEINSYYKSIAEQDDVLQNAIEIIQSDWAFKKLN
ncbi:MAG: S41 family peptidase [Lentimicrobiaceae bacterium]|nr:S41 family peptidase [Lentimicrobiaceae bacterium]